MLQKKKKKLKHEVLPTSNADVMQRSSCRDGCFNDIEMKEKSEPGSYNLLYEALRFIVLTSCSVPSSKISKTFKMDTCIHARSTSEYYAPVCFGLKVVGCYIRLHSLVPFFFFLFISSPATFPQNEEQCGPVEDDQRLYLDTHRPTEPRRLSSLRDLAVVAPCQKFRSGNTKACCFVLLCFVSASLTFCYYPPPPLFLA